MRFAGDVGDFLVFMHDGRVHEYGAATTLFAYPQGDELKSFIYMMA